MLNWNSLLSSSRCSLPGPTDPTPRPDRTERFRRSPFEADADRVLFSHPFRRLAGKTQVHPLADEPHVHNRLTHSLEVASVGRTLGRMLGEWLAAKNELPQSRCAEDVAWVVQAACLVHDIGNPPFGHAGEYAIREWVRCNREVLFPASLEVDEKSIQDALMFEGNAQGFRMAARADSFQPGCWLRLTDASLGAMVKYPWNVSDPRTEEKSKHGVYHSEDELFQQAWQRMGLQDDSGKVCRHPLSYLSEAADDLCYRILDLEDAVIMDIVPESEVVDLLARVIGESSGGRSVAQLRARAVGRGIDLFFETFVENYSSIMQGNLQGDLLALLPKEQRAALADVKEHYRRIFSHRTKIATELGAYKVVGRILRAAGRAVESLCVHRSYDNAGFIAQRTLDLIFSESWTRAHEQFEHAWWIHQIMDQVASMTDRQATRLSREIDGT